MSDVPRVVEIERLAYPSTWPPSAYRKELQDNRWAHYIVLRDKKIVEERATVPAQEYEKPRRIFPLSLLPSRPSATLISPDLASIIGFSGLWLMVDYSDNQEDALIMWTDEISSLAYKQKFYALKIALVEKLEQQ